MTHQPSQLDALADAIVSALAKLLGGDQAPSPAMRIVLRDCVVGAIEAHEEGALVASNRATFSPERGRTRTKMLARLDSADPLSAQEQGRLRVALASRILSLALQAERSARECRPGGRAQLYKTAIGAYETVAALVAPNPDNAPVEAQLLPVFLRHRLPKDFDRLPRPQQLLALEAVARGGGEYTGEPPAPSTPPKQD